MNMFFDLVTVQQGIQSYDQILANMDAALESIKVLREGVDHHTWSGEGKEAFCKACELWQKRTRIVYADIVETRESLVEYAANQSDLLKHTCEGFGDIY